MLKILVIGSGAREHAIVRAINRSPKKKEIHCLATNYNPGIAEICKMYENLMAKQCFWRVGCYRMNPTKPW